MHVQDTPLPAGQGTVGHGPAKPEPKPARRATVAYTVAEVAELLGKHPNTIYGWVRSGVLPAERFGRSIFIPRSALAALAPLTGEVSGR